MLNINVSIDSKTFSKLTLNNLNKLLAEFDIDEIGNSNINVSSPGKRGLHLNNSASFKFCNFA